jgi:hypothetical protein
VLQARYRTALFVWVASLSGELLNVALKQRSTGRVPQSVPHLRVVFSTSFPSGHAMDQRSST